MAPRGSKKDLSVKHEDFVAAKYGGKRSRSSGAADHDQGDVRVEDDHNLFECKGKFGIRTGAKEARSTLVTQMEKVADEAYAEGKDPALALRFYMPTSTLADNEGYVDLTVRVLHDDADLLDALRQFRAEVDQSEQRRLRQHPMSI